MPRAKGPPKKMGRPKIELDLHQLKSLMRLTPSLKDTADFFDVSEDKIEDTIKENWGLTFPEFRDKNAVQSRLGIKRKMMEKALAGDNTMLIWLSKNLLGMSDRVEQKQEITFSNLSNEELDARIKELEAKSGRST